MDGKSSYRNAALADGDKGSGSVRDSATVVLAASVVVGNANVA